MSGFRIRIVFSFSHKAMHSTRASSAKRWPNKKWPSHCRVKFSVSLSTMSPTWTVTLSPPLKRCYNKTSSSLKRTSFWMSNKTFWSCLVWSWIRCARWATSLKDRLHLSFTRTRIELARGLCISSGRPWRWNRLELFWVKLNSGIQNLNTQIHLNT